MGLRMPKAGRGRGPVVTPLEHHVPVNWTVVGTPQWLDEGWEDGALDGVEVVTVTDESALVPVLTHLESMRILGVDTETAGPYIAGDKGYSMNPLNPEPRLVLLQLGNQAQSYLVDPALVSAFKPLLESDQVLHVGHNLIYDFKWLLVKCGIHMQRLYCSMLAEQLLTAGLMGVRVNLADSVRRRAPYWIINKAVRNAFIHLDHHLGCPDCDGGTHRRLTREMGYYAARDITLLFPLLREQMMELKHWQLNRVAQVEFDIIAATAEMEIEGVDLSLTVMRQIIEYWTQREKDLAEEFFAIFNEERKKTGKAPESLVAGLDAVFNLKSNAAKLAALRELDIDLDNLKRDTLKEASKDKDITPAQRRLLLISAEISNVFKMTTTYGKNMVDKISAVTGRWHPRFKQLGSGEEEGRRSGSEDKSTIATGRFSSDAQQFPKPKELFVPVKAAKEVAHVTTHFATEIAAIKAAAAAPVEKPA
jgi:hypothetical protein